MKTTMWKVPWRIFFFLSLLLGSLVSGAQEEEANERDPGLNRYVSRPDLTPTKWNVTTYHEDRLAPGYWFCGPYRILDQKTFGQGWVGAHIYDQKGELVWSGAKMFSKGNIEDFRVSNVNGEYLMTLMDQGRGEAVIFDNHFEVREIVKLDHFNSHELHFVNDGTRALVIKSHQREATKEMEATIGYYGDRRCRAGFDKFVELDVTNNWKPTFEWSAWENIGLDESTLNENSVERRCGQGGWDYLHTNSVDKTPYGDYLLSGRHTDTIYKISKDDKSIIWRLGGVKSDFPIEGDLKFSRQHDVRFRGENETHLLISILDNAKGIDHAFAPTHKFSRGLLLAINEREMTVSIEKQLDHPFTEDRFSPRRGNYQVLPNDNIFMGWSEQGCQSEHSPDGTLLQEAIYSVKWLGTYRQYKFPFVGLPLLPPDVHAEALGAENNDASTVVHVSWNGATEVRTWKLYKTTSKGESEELLASADKLGFETKLEHDNYAAYVIVKGLDKDGEVLGSSKVLKTIVNNNVPESALEAERQWLQGKGDSGLLNRLPSVSDHPISSFLVGFVFSAGVLLAGWYARRKGVFRLFRSARYSRLRQAKENPGYQDFAEEFDEQSLPLRSSRKESLDDDR